MSELKWTFDLNRKAWTRPKSAVSEIVADDPSFVSIELPPNRRGGVKNRKKPETSSSPVSEMAEAGAHPRKLKGDVGSFEHKCPDCDSKLVSVNIAGGTRWECKNPDCEPIPPLSRLSVQQKATMRQPGVNPWNDFCHSMKGKGYTPDQLRQMYHQKKEQLEGKDVHVPQPITPSPKPVNVSKKVVSSTSVSKASGSGATQTCVYNLNTVAKAQLLSIPDITETLAKNILAFRDDRQFTRVSELNDVPRIGRVTYGRISSYFFVPGQKE